MSGIDPQVDVDPFNSNDNVDDLDLNQLRKSIEEAEEDGLHKDDEDEEEEDEGKSSTPTDRLIDKTPDYLLVDKTPDGHRRIRGQKRPALSLPPPPPPPPPTAEDQNNNWGVSNKLPPPPQQQSSTGRGSYIPYPSSGGGGGTEQQQQQQSVSPVELQVTNIDQSMDQKEMKKLITSLFREHVAVLRVSVFFQSDGNMAACVRVPSIVDAQFAISQLHRKKVGYKRILISHSHNSNSQNLAVLRSKVASILKEVPAGGIQLFKFREMFEKRFHDSIGISDLYKLKDLVVVTDDSDGRMVQLSGGGYEQNAPPGLADKSWLCESIILSGSTKLTEPLSNGVVLDPAFCSVHSSLKDADETVGWAERENCTLLPNVNISLSVLGPNIKQLIKSHGGALPLASLTTCYAAVFGSDNALVVDAVNGVPLEHLVSCIKDVQISQAASGAKRLSLTPVSLSSSSSLAHMWNLNNVYGNRPEDVLSEAASSLCNYSPFSTPGGGGGGSLSSPMASSNSSSTSSSLTNLNQISFGSGYHGGSNTAAATPLAGQLSLFTRELVDLMKNAPDCRMPFHKFIPSYHHHFGRQCRVADYGYTKLKDLFEALPHVLQIMGEGRSRAIITLSHRAQVKRFTSDLLRVLKSQASKQISLAELPLAFEKALNRKFKITDYGVCDVEDILQEVSETSVVLSGDPGGDDFIISIPKREQTQDEMERTHLFAQDCIELLRHAPECRLPFNKFVPAYHHHFGHQCRVADYGFTKLIELFEAIPFVVEISEDADGERLLQLTDGERLAVLGGQIESLMVNAGKQVIALDQLEDMYRRQYGYPLRPDDYGETAAVSVLKNLPQVLRISDETEQEVVSVRLIDKTYIKTLGLQVKEILSEEPEGRMKMVDFEAKYRSRFGSGGCLLNLKDLKSDLTDLVVVDNEEEEEEDGEVKTETSIALTRLHLCSVKIQKLLEAHQDRLPCCEFEAAFVEQYGVPLCPGQYGHPSLNSLIQALPEYFAVRGRGPRKMVWYLRDGPPSQDASLSRSAATFGSSRSIYSRQQQQQQVPQGATRFSTSRQEGFRLTTSTTMARSQRPAACRQLQQHYDQGSRLHARGGGPFPPPPPLPTLSMLPRRFPHPPPFPSTQQEMDLAQFGLFPRGHNGQMVAGAAVGRAPPPPTIGHHHHRQGFAFPPYQSSSSNVFLSTPGNANCKLFSTSPISPLLSGPSLFPVPHSPSLPMLHQNGFLGAGAGGSFVFSPSSSSNFWDHPSTPSPNPPT